MFEERYARKLLNDLERIRKNPGDLLTGRVIRDATVEYSNCCDISAVVLNFEDGSNARITRYGIEFDENRE